ncbi:Defective in cullin neddylation protein 1 [Fonsecaea pedrosoi]|nr:Defective in cullin neddylation protein 1 [Fonsecaea pedrosoi]
MPPKRKSADSPLLLDVKSPKTKKVKPTASAAQANLAKSSPPNVSAVMTPMSVKVPTRARRGGGKAPRSKAPGFYQSGSGNNSVPPIQHNLNKLFDQYCDNPKDAPDTIGIEGAQKYLTDLGVELDEVAHLGICDLLQCPSIGEFERESFVSGWRSVSSGDKTYDTIARQAQYVDVIRKKLANTPAYFRQVYRNAFKLAKPEGQRSVPVDSAIDFWNMFFRQGKGGIEWNSPSTQWLDLWCEFYESQIKRPVNKDLWNMVGELVMKTKEPDGESLSWWTEDGAWPMAIDDFVNFIREKRKVSGDNMDTS